MPVKEVISSGSVRLFEGTAKELVPKAKLPPDMHGFAIVVPGGDVHEWKLDLVWRIAILYAFGPGFLKSRAKVTRLVEAVMRGASRPKSDSEGTTVSKLRKPRPDASEKPARRVHR